MKLLPAKLKSRKITGNAKLYIEKIPLMMIDTSYNILLQKSGLSQVSKVTQDTNCKRTFKEKK